MNLFFFLKKSREQKKIRKLAIEASKRIMQRIEQIPRNEENVPTIIKLVTIATLLGSVRSKERLDKLLNSESINHVK